MYSSAEQQLLSDKSNVLPEKRGRWKLVDEANKQVTQLQDQLDRMRQALATAEIQRAAMLNSWSWRLTSPLRAFVDIFLSRGVRRGLSRSNATSLELKPLERKGEATPEILLDNVASEYDLTREFVGSYFANQGIDISYCSNAQEIIDRLDPLQQMWVSFALSTTVRGNEVANLVDKVRTFSYDDKSPRYLDVGCAYGGFLRAFSRKGFSVTGMEIDPGLADYGRQNIKGLEDAQIIEADFLNYPIETLQPYDLITCNDVIEHVQDAELALKRLSGLVKHGGTLFMEIPNKDCIDFVASDGHFQLFAINCLRRPEAKRYYQQVKDKSSDYSGMGEFYELDYYVNALKGAGLTVKLVPRHEICSFEVAGSRIENMQSAHARWMERWMPQRMVLDSIQIANEAYESYRRRMLSDYASAISGGDRCAFVTKYLTSFWTLIAQRH